HWLNRWPLISRHYPNGSKERRKIKKSYRHRNEHPGQEQHEAHNPHRLFGNRRQQRRPEHHDLIHDSPSLNFHAKLSANVLAAVYRNLTTSGRPSHQGIGVEPGPKPAASNKGLWDRLGRITSP